MKGKLIFAAGLGIGYLLGARAGRKRYDQIVAVATKVWETPAIQTQVHKVEDFAAEQVGNIPGAVFSGVSTLFGKTAKAAARRRTTARPAAAPTEPPAAPAEGAGG
ncbi:hypothetical protein [Gryllotalpicola sp.]|uniref:hypothetical protein n=1 Tax=Gryllotalpicola sp. TaxID=1932787 RepID=UPI00262328FD|nr:hypothetical protein [Gryllotalpicola sp.]